MSYPSKPLPAGSNKKYKDSAVPSPFDNASAFSLHVDKQLDISTIKKHKRRLNWFSRFWNYRGNSQNDIELGRGSYPLDGSNNNGSRKGRSASIPSLAFGFNDNESMGDYMEAHILAALQRTSLNNITMTFHDPETEYSYSKYFLEKTLNFWWRYAIISMFLSSAVQLLLTNFYPEIVGASGTADMLLLWVGGVLPMLCLLLANWRMKKAQRAKWIHVLSVLYLLVLGPIQICGRYFIANKEKYPPSLTSPLYILILVSSVFFFRMRFIATVIAMSVSIGVWLAIFGTSITYSITGDVVTSFTTSAFGMVLGGIVICFIAYEQERGSRFQYLSDHRFLRINNKLQNQLKGLQSNFKTKIADLESPLEKAILGLKTMMANPQITADLYDTLDMVLTCLNSPNLLQPDLEKQVTRGQVEVNSEQEKWLFNGIAQRDDVDDIGLKAQLPRKSQDLSLKRDEGFIFKSRDDVDMLETDEAKRLLRHVDEFNFDIFAFEKATMGNPLLVLANELIVRRGLLDRLGLPVDKFLNFIQTLEAGYHKDLAFHNSLHASDVLHCIHYLASRPSISALFSDLELLGIYMAAAMHDFDHPGLNNQFLIATGDPRAIRYNDKSVLENHHCSKSFQVLMRDECNFLQSLDRAAYKKLREQIVDMVLATDLARHFELLGIFKKKVMTGSNFDPANTREDRNLLLQIMIKCSDVSNPTKAFSLYEEWIHRIIEEWYVQGDKERELGLPISPFCNREVLKGAGADGRVDVNLHQSSQKGFIEFIVWPMVEAFSTWTNEIEVVRRGLEINRERWSKEPETKKKEVILPPATFSPERRRSGR
ncbi:cAMP-specific 3',5'-cyclic phosphodiesterase 4D [Nowakowskiella sp. JEL0407]|nr:cAMP-specific 3',5'-cyclic phosphodiesterase 4D [Nowakowskiella sp. JEL0407]